jgi:hypothetical protein
VAFSQLNKFEGKSVIVDAEPAGGSCAVKYGGDPTIDVISGAPTAIFDCAGNLLGNTPRPVARSQTSGYWCFQGPANAYKVSFTYASTPPAAVTYNYWPAKTNGSGYYNVKDFGAKGDGVIDDTAAIKNAIAFIAAQQGGTLFFPEGQYIVGESKRGITLPPGIILQGVNGMPKDTLHNYFEPKQFSSIKLLGTNRPLFRIGECTDDVRLKNLALIAESTTRTYGIEAMGTVFSSGFINLDDVSFSLFDIGFYAHNVAGSGASWHFDYLKLSQNHFAYNKTAGIWIDLFNTDWTISDTVFLTPAYNPGVSEADGIKIVTAGSVTVENSWGGGTGYTPAQRGGDFIDITNIGSLTVIKSGSERGTASIKFAEAPGAGSNSSVLTLVNNIFGEPLILNGRVTFVSTGNLYLGNNVQTTEHVKVYSTGDRFCYDAASAYFPAPNPANTLWPCGDVGPNQTLTHGGFQGPGQIVFETGQRRDFVGGINSRVVEGRPTRFGTDMVINADGDYPTNSGLSILSDDANKPLLRLGGGTSNTYNVQRDPDGSLFFTGLESPTSRAFRFDAPVGLPSMNQEDLPESVADGSMVYCANCSRDTAPCKAGGTGAPATRIARTWECK